MNRHDRLPPASPLLGIQPGESAKPDHRDDVVATLISTIVHASILVVLMLWVLPSISKGKTVLEFSPGEVESFSLESISKMETVPEPSLQPSKSAAAQVELFQPAPLAMLSLEPLQKAADVDVSVASFATPMPRPDAMASSSTIAAAVDRITGELEARLERGDLLVVWLLDASHSLVDDRQRVAERLGPFYDGLKGGPGDSRHELHSVVVSYGAAMRERVRATQFGDKIVRAVEDLPIDRTGKENVFDAVAKCAANYRQSWPDQQITIVIWTDESGDDVADLEHSIEVCRTQQVSVSVVGPSSVLGADTGLHSYTDPKTHSLYQLPVRRGPDTAMAERLELDYWFMTSIRGGRGNRPGGNTPSWAGGQDLVGILSGFSPYALTRLTMQTGGSYTIFDRSEDRAPFDHSVMQRYQPTYPSRQEYEQEILAHPLRRALMAAVAETRGKNLDEPPTMLFIKRTGERLFDFMRFYYSPNEFLAKLRSSRGRLKGQSLRSSKIIEQALRHLSTDETLEVGLEDFYEYEESPRWRAWYDLTRGRLLATSARLEEYRLVIDEMVKPGSLAGTTNHVILVAQQQTRGDEKFQRQADEAEFLLRRCVRENQGTPWEILAQRELDYAIGMGARELSLTRQPGGPATRGPVLPKF